MKAPLGAAITDAAGTGRSTLTRDLAALSFSKTAQGGLRDVQVPLVGVDPDDFDYVSPACRLWLHDGRTGDCVAEGYLEIPDRSRRGALANTGDTQLTARGPAALADETSIPLVYVDRDLGNWVKTAGTPASGEVSTSADPSATDTNTAVQGVLIKQNPGVPVGPQSAAASAPVIAAEYALPAGATAGTVVFAMRGGRTDTGWEIDWVPFGPGGATGTARTLGTLSTTARVVTLTAGSASDAIPDGTTSLRVRLRRTGAATNITTDDVWVWLSGITVAARRYDRTGALLSGAAQAAQSTVGVRADWVVEDLIGRGLIPADPMAVTIQAGTVLIEQLSYPDGTTAANVLTNLATYEPDLLWQMGPSTTTGRHSFTYRAWPTEPRYDLSAADGYEASGSENDLCNRIVVYWTDSAGVKRSTIRTTSVAALTDPLTGQVRVRDAESVTLPDGRGSEADAARIGDAILATKAAPSNAAVVTVLRPVVDRLTGRVVDPWQLEPGYTARVRETGDVLRITELTYTDADVATRLTLGEPTLTNDQRLAVAYADTIRRSRG